MRRQFNAEHPKLVVARAPALLLLLALLLALNPVEAASTRGVPRRRGPGGAPPSSAVAPEQVVCHRNCEAAARQCCSSLGRPACDITCARGRFLCRQRCGPPSRPCQRRCFLSFFDCLEDCNRRGLSGEACQSQCKYFPSFACLLDCRRRDA